MDNYTQVEIIKSWLDEHWTDVLKYYGAKMKEASAVEKVPFNKDRIKGMLATYVSEGVSKVVNVDPSELSGVTDDLVTRCKRATANAEAKAGIALAAATNANRAADEAEAKALLAQTATANANDAAAAANSAADSAAAKLEEIEASEATRRSNETARQNAEAARANEFNTISAQAATDHSDSQTATVGAEKVNATLTGTTVTVTDRNGTSRSTNIGFEFYRTYTSVAAMNADAANVPQGKFVIIATTGTTDPDNAKMYVKNSQGSFTFVCDIDQASAEAWADWLNNMKPAVEDATDEAESAAEHATQQGDYAKEWNEHPPYIGDGRTGDLNYWYVWVNHAYVKSSYAKGDDIDWTTMSQEEYERLVQNVKQDLVFATAYTCEDIIDELV